MRALTGRSFAALCAGVALLALVALSAVNTSRPVSAAPSLYVVSPSGSDGAAGTPDAPLRTLGRAVELAADGDRIELRDGTYRESVEIFEERLIIAAAPGATPVLDGSERIDGWRSEGDGRYSAFVSVSHPVETGPNVERSRPAGGHPDQVFINGRPLRQVLNLGDVAPGSFYFDRNSLRVWLADDPRFAEVSVSTLPYALYFHRAHGSELENITVRRYATPERDMAAIRGYSNDLVFSGLSVEQNARMGVSLIGDGVVIRDSRLIDNGHLGLHVHESDGVVADRLAVLGNNKAGFDPFHAAGGIKVTTSTALTIRDSDVSFNDGVGIWTDLSVDRATIIGNISEGNGRSGIEIELSSRVNVVDNVAIDNGEYGVWVLESGDVQVFHNALFGNHTEVAVLEGPRREVQRVRVRNNVLGSSRTASEAVMKVEDWTGERSAYDMDVSIDRNGYWLPSASADLPLLLWDDAPGRSTTATTLKAVRRLLGQSESSVLLTTDDNGFARNPAAADYRTPAGTPPGVALQGAMAEMLGVAEGEQLPIGPTAPSELRRD